MTKVVGYGLQIAGYYYDMPWLVAAGTAILAGDGYERNVHAIARPRTEPEGMTL